MQAPPAPQVSAGSVVTPTPALTVSAPAASNKAKKVIYVNPETGIKGEYPSIKQAAKDTSNKTDDVRGKRKFKWLGFCKFNRFFLI